MPKVPVRHQNSNLGCEEFRTQAGYKTTWRKPWGCRSEMLADTGVESGEGAERHRYKVLDLLLLSEIQIPQPKRGRSALLAEKTVQKVLCLSVGTHRWLETRLKAGRGPQ